jgi:hypothetical protein
MSRGAEGDAVKRIVMLCLLGCIGCGDDDGMAVQKCDDLFDDVCDRGVECVPQQTGTHASCVQQLQQILACESARTVSMTYDRCIQQVKGAGCQDLFPTAPQTGRAALSLPADCTGVIQMFEPGAPIARSPFRAAAGLSAVSAD